MSDYEPSSHKFSEADFIASQQQKLIDFFLEYPEFQSPLRRHILSQEGQEVLPEEVIDIITNLAAFDSTYAQFALVSADRLLKINRKSAKRDGIW